jgi:hypothetical protein
MQCSKPLSGYLQHKADGKRKLQLNKHADPDSEAYIQVPCGKCLGCKLEYSRQWAVRLVHESNYWEPDQQHFITLTYNNENLPLHGNLVKKDYQDFMKRLRKHHVEKYGYPDLNHKKEPTIAYPMKYFHAGEYGKSCRNCGKSKFYHGTNSKCKHWSPTIGRPHYHAILYGSQFPDMELKEKSDSGKLLYESETLNSLWGKGFTTIGEVTFESCSYVARYVTKKIYGKDAHEHYKKPIKVDSETGEVTEFFQMQKEYVTMSRGNRYNPDNALSKKQMDYFKKDIYPHDRVVMYRTGESIPMRPPRYYDKLLEKSDPEMYDSVKEKRMLKAKEMKKETQESLDSKAEILEQRTQTLYRNLDN